MSTAYYLYHLPSLSLRYSQWDFAATLEGALAHKEFIGVRTAGPQHTLNFRFAMPIAQFIGQVDDFHGVIDEYGTMMLVYGFVENVLAECKQVIYEADNIPTD